MKILTENLERAEQTIRTNPRNAHAWQARGDALMSLNRFQEAAKSYESALKIKPQQAELLNSKGYALCRQAASLKEATSLLLEALNTLEAAVKIEPFNIHYLANQAEVLRILGETTKASALYDTIEKIQLEAELTECEQQLKKYPPLSPTVYAEYFNRKGELLLQLQQPQEALAAFATVLQMEPGNSLYQTNHQQALARIAKPEEKTSRLEIKMTPAKTLAEATNSLDTKKTEAERAQSLEQKSDPSPVLTPPSRDQVIPVYLILKKGSELLNQNRYDEALTWYDTQLKSQPDHPDWLREKIRVLWLMHRYEEALVIADKAVAIHPQNKALWRQKIAVLKRLNHYEGAVVCYDALLRIQPLEINDLIEKAFLLSHSLKQTEAALQYYDQALKVEPKNTSALWLKAVTLHRRQRYTEALILYNTVLAINPQHAIVLNYKAELLQDMSTTPKPSPLSSINVFAEAKISSDRRPSNLTKQLSTHELTSIIPGGFLG